MAKPLDAFKPIEGDEPFEERIAAFNRVGANIDRLHECADVHPVALAAQR